MSLKFFKELETEKEIDIDANYVDARLQELIKDEDLTGYIL